MDEWHQEGLSSRQRKFIAIRILLILLCVFILYAVNFQDQKYCWGKNATASPKPVEE